MLQIGRYNVYNLENSIRGARNAYNSWDNMDSYYNGRGEYILGANDLALAKKLCRAGSDHRKFLRQIFVSVDISAPLYWWKEYDTYKVGTTANSTSTMHTIHSKRFEPDDFSHDKLDAASEACLMKTVEYLEMLRGKYNETKEKSYWYNIIQLLPSSFRQLRTCTLSYENLVNMYNARKNHRLDEWHVFCGWISTLPYAGELITFKKEKPKA